jgi:hypothetical protein
MMGGGWVRRIHTIIASQPVQGERGSEVTRTTNLGFRSLFEVELERAHRKSHKHVKVRGLVLRHSLASSASGLVVLQSATHACVGHKPHDAAHTQRTSPCSS